MKQLFVSHVGGSIVPGAATRGIVRPFKIGLGHSEVIVLLKLRVVYYPIGDVEQVLNWRLISKRETEQIATVAPLTNSNLNELENHDMLAQGVFSHFTTATQGDAQVQMAPQHIDFPEPHITLPRPPTLILRNSANQTINIAASLYFLKKKLGANDMLEVLNRFVGRKEDVVSNVPPVIDE